MLITAELLLSYQRCKRQTFLDVHGDVKTRNAPSDLLLKLQQERSVHRQTVLSQQIYHQPDYPKGDWNVAAKATLALMQQGVERIYRGVLLAPLGGEMGELGERRELGREENSFLSEDVRLLSRPDLLIRQPGQSSLGDWIYLPAQIELGKRPKLEYQIIAAYNARVLAEVQGADPQTAHLMLRTKKNQEVKCYVVHLAKWWSQMQQILENCIQTLRSPQAPEVFIARQRCSLCRWYSSCYALAKSQQHLSLLPGVTPNRYTQLQALNLTSIKSLVNTNPAHLDSAFGSKVAQHLVLQAQSILHQQPLLISPPASPAPLVPLSPCPLVLFPPSPIELYFDIEAEPDLNLDYLLGVLVVDRSRKTETFYSLLAEQPAAEGLIWQQFLNLVWQYPLAPIFHFCSYEVDTVKRLAKLYHTPKEQVQPLMSRFIDIYERLTQTVVLPVESYALKSIARWVGFDWHDPQANGSQCIYWYDQWLKTGDRTLLHAIQRYNEDDCRATYRVKDWLVSFVQNLENCHLP